MNPKINILIRTFDRPNLFSICLNSIIQQTYKNYEILVYDNSSVGVNYIPENIKKIRDEKSAKGYDYNLFCNVLKNEVKEGWFIFVDDDDFLVGDNALQTLVDNLPNEDEVLIFQILRNQKSKPNNRLIDEKRIIKGHISTQCFAVHSKHKNIADFTNIESGDYDFIRTATQKLKPIFKKIILVNSLVRNHGLQENRIS